MVKKQRPVHVYGQNRVYRRIMSPIRVLVGVLVVILVGVLVSVLVEILVGVLVRVLVEVLVGVLIEAPLGRLPTCGCSVCRLEGLIVIDQLQLCLEAASSP